VRFHVVSGADLSPFADASFDLVVSCLVFQHIPGIEAVRSYLREIGRVLSPEGRAVLQFDTRRESLAARLYKSLPDIMLPRAHRRFIRRYRRSAELVRAAMRGEGLAIIAEPRGAGTAEHWFVCARNAPADC
jgi:ubiquinone/menaquinone biosynthesis C-methylase UbiE